MYRSSLFLPFASDVGRDCPPWLRDTGSELVPALHYKRLSPKIADLSKWGGPVHRCRQTGWLQGPVSVRTHNIRHHEAGKVLTVQKVTGATVNHGCAQRIYLNDILRQYKLSKQQLAHFFFFKLAILGLLANPLGSQWLYQNEHFSKIAKKPSYYMN